MHEGIHVRVHVTCMHVCYGVHARVATDSTFVLVSVWCCSRCRCLCTTAPTLRTSLYEALKVCLPSFVNLALFSTSSYFLALVPLSRVCVSINLCSFYKTAMPSQLIQQSYNRCSTEPQLVAASCSFRSCRALRLLKNSNKFELDASERSLGLSSVCSEEEIASLYSKRRQSKCIH